MLATAYSLSAKALPGWVLHPRRWRIWLAVALLLLPGASVRGATNGLSGPAQFRTFTEQTLATARKRLLADPTNSAALLEFARAGFDRGEFAKDDDEREVLAEECIAICRKWVKQEPDSVAAHYYLSMNLGQLARTKSLGALRIVDEMEGEFKAAWKLDEHFDFAGPDRNLGLLYRDAPSWGSIGDRRKAKQHLLRAIELSPDFPENQLNLAEACLKWVDRPGAIRQMRALDGIWEAARGKLTGPTWSSSWADWTRRRADLNAKIEVEQKTGSPKHRS